jgi:hypothetical protein
VGLYGLLFSPGKSVFLFCPLLLAAAFQFGWLARKSRPLFVFALGSALLYLVIYSKWWAWYGGGCWGPRLLIPVTPILSLAALGVIDRWREITPAGKALFGAVVLAGFIVQVPGYSFRFCYDWNYWMSPNYGNEYLEWFTPKYSPLSRLWLHLRDHPGDLDFSFLKKDMPRLTNVRLPPRAIRRIRITQTGANAEYWWSVAELHVYFREGGREKQVDAATTRRAATGASGGQDHLGSMFDGNAGTRWSTRQTKRPGQYLILDFGNERRDLTRVELDVGTFVNDYPNGLAVDIAGSEPRWEAVPPENIDGTRLTMHLSPWAAAPAGVLLACAALLLLLL